jgi:hypothetical protein
VFFVGVMVGTSGAETKTETVTKTKTVEVAGTIPQAEINKYKAQGRQEGKATAEADIEARLDRAEAKGRDDQKREDQAAADKALQDAAAAAAKAEVGPGTLIVGTDIQPGRYQTTAGGDILDSVYWARLSSLDGGGGVDNIIDNGNATGLTTIEIQPTDVAFETTGTWTKIG